MENQLHGMLPIAATEMAEKWDNLYYFLLAICVFFFFLVVIPMVLFAIRYRKKPGVKPTYITHHDTLEIIWTAIPTVILMVIFAWGWVVYRDMYDEAPSDAMEIRVMAQSWGWQFQYDDGRITNDLLFVPVDRDVKLVMSSKQGDVLHSFFVPNFRIKKDLVPGVYTTSWFNTSMPGRHQFFCAEYCGAGHSIMRGAVVALDEEQWKEWNWGRELDLAGIPWVGVGGLREQILNQTTAKKSSTAIQSASFKKNHPENLVETGAQLMRSRGCVVCHSDDGSKRIGPSYKGIYGNEALLSDGERVIRDENYIRESIENPQAKVVKGYEHLVMPPYPGQMSDAEMNALVAYIKSRR